MRDLNFFSSYHTPPKKSSPLRLALIGGGSAAAALFVLAAIFFQLSNMDYQKKIADAENMLKSPEMAEQLTAVSETENKIATVKNDQVLFKNLEGDFQRIHRVNRSFLEFLNKKVTRNLVFNDIKVNYDSVEIQGSSRERLSIAKFEEELRKTDKFNHIIVSDIENKDDGGAANVAPDDPNKDIYNFNIKIITKDVDFNDK
ncbi:PilN domain-containing protein [Streptococcus oricebi]|uniref:Fimbrial assembly protein n=1 Tax=Streptococcus oricebi TaxID=1547447 RepID=A0ABS5B5S7_9STRE|nr:PilN domain-containing protein [Streptococcus oricebi]MBP2624187.1 fimbrial assembly protein [Streptococcus oricebi]